MHVIALESVRMRECSTDQRQCERQRSEEISLGDLLLRSPSARKSSKKSRQTLWALYNHLHFVACSPGCSAVKPASSREISICTEW